MTNTNDYCNVCAERYTNKNKKITCTSCDYESCTQCIHMYFTTSKASPQCMQCHRPWNHQFIMENFGSTNSKRIMNTQKELLYQEQKSLFPHTQNYSRLKQEYESNNEKLKDLTQRINQLKREKTELYNGNLHIYRNMQNIESDFLANHNNTTATRYSTQKVTGEKKEYIQACNKDECKGFVDNKGVCGMCKATYCTQCMREKTDSEHVCNQDDILTIELIKKDSKNCPKCNCLIHRISGCPDMFCVTCHTTFNWNTLKIDENGNSNPLYYKWIREGRNGAALLSDDNVDCEYVDLFRTFQSKNYKSLESKTKNIVSNALQSLDHSYRFFHNHMQNIMSSRDFETLTLNIRTQFMNNKTTEKNYKTQLMKIYKAKEYNTNMLQIKDLVNVYKRDMMRYIIHSPDFDVKKCISECLNFADYINDCMTYLRNVFYSKDERLTYIQFNQETIDFVKVV